jgi:hypothetical protein
MKFKDGKSYWDNNEEKWVYKPKIYTDFYCSLDEWAKLGCKKAKRIFMYQARSRIAEMHGGDCSKFKLDNGIELYKVSFDRTGRRDGLSTEEYSASIIRDIIKLMTHRDANVEFYSWKGTIDHIEIAFPNSAMPNIICLIDDYNSSTNDTLIFCIDCIYKTLSNKRTKYYDTYLCRHYNDRYDIVYLKPDSEHISENYIKWRDKYMWKDIIKQTSMRKYIDRVSIDYKL